MVGVMTSYIPFGVSFHDSLGGGLGSRLACQLGPEIYLSGNYLAIPPSPPDKSLTYPIFIFTSYPPVTPQTPKRGPTLPGVVWPGEHAGAVSGAVGRPQGPENQVVDTLMEWYARISARIDPQASRHPPEATLEALEWLPPEVGKTTEYLQNTFNTGNSGGRGGGQSPSPPN